MNENIIRFPGFLDLGNGYGQGAKGYQHGCKHYKTFASMVRDLPERDRERTYRWHVKREGVATRKAAVLCRAIEA
jgi:hypothetical protein